MSESGNQPSPQPKDSNSGSALGLLILAGIFALVGFGLGFLKGFLAEEGGGWALGLDLGWKHAILLMLMIAAVLPVAGLLKHFQLPPIVSGVVVMAFAFAFMWVGGAIIDRQWENIGRNLLSGAGQGAVVGLGFGTLHLLGWIKSPFR